MMKNFTRSLACAGCLLIGSAASAQYVEPPTILPTNLDRRAFAEAAADGNFCDRDETLNGEVGPFSASTSVDCSGMHGSGGSGTGQQLTRISTYSISGTGSVSANATVGSHENAWVGLNVATLIQATFTVPVDAGLWLRGSFDVTGVNDTNGTCGEDTEVRVFLAGTAANGTNIFFDQRSRCQDPPENADFELFETLKTNTNVTLLVLAQSGLGTEFPTHRLGERTASFDFDFDVGICPDPCVPPSPGDPNFDSDRDGLIDSWETDGIDFDGDGQPEIDLPEMGTIVGRSDLLVEVDIMESAAFDQTAIDDVVQAFAEAPAIQSNGEPGINLIVLVDTDQPAHVQLQQLANGDLPPEYYIIKSAFFGTEADRSHPDWDQIRPVLLGIFRYCLWGDTIFKPNGRQFTGLAEAIPSNDFFVAGTLINAVYSDPTNAINGLAGTFMHELGHTLGLHHAGGDEDTPNYKPNYFSVMNYSYQLPIERVTPQGTHAEEAWRLDYSRSATRSLDEGALLETAGLDGPAGRMMLFNSELPGNPSVINIGWAQTDWVDWNNNMMPDPLAYERDISNISNDSLSLDVLNSYEDRDRLQIGSSGGMYFNDREPWPYAQRIIEEGMDEDSYAEIKNADWVDQTALGDLIFENGFELGSTTTWSDTVP